MRIIHTTLRYPPSSGGAEQYAKELVERTRSVQDKRDVRVLSSLLRTHGPISELDRDLLLDDPIYVQRLHYAKTPFISYPRLQALSYYIQHHQPTILESYGFWYQPADITARYARTHHIPFIFHPLYYENAVRKKVLWQMYKKTIGHATFKAADVVAVLSTYEQSLITQAGFSVKRFELLPPGIDHSLYQHTLTNPFEARNIQGTILLSVGRISTGKGLESIMNVLPEIIRQHPNTQWVIVGEDFGAKAQLKKEAARLGITKHIHWLGKLSDEEKIACFQYATIFIHPSRYEAFGIVLAEAMSSGLPIIARNIAAIPYVVPDQKAGLLFNTEPELTAHILKLVASLELQRQYATYGKSHSMQHFNWDTTIKKLIQIYEEFSS